MLQIIIFVINIKLLIFFQKSVASLVINLVFIENENDQNFNFTRIFLKYSFFSCSLNFYTPKKESYVILMSYKILMLIPNIKY